MNLQQELLNDTILQGKYKITERLGQGGFGITYKAENTILGTIVCIKELFIGGICSRGSNNTVQSQTIKDVSFDYFKKRFMEEARGLAKFNHPGIVRVTDVFEENNTAYFVMDFAEGQTLKQMVNEGGALATEKSISLILNLLDAVEEVHSKHMLHRDIKPDNIIITADGKAILIDFGSARDFADDYTITQTAILTPGYAPVEQYSDKTKRGPYTDIYALGATFYFILTGVKPIAATDRFLETLKSPELLNPLVSKTLASVVMLAMNLNPQDRFQTIAEMRKALQSQKKEIKPKPITQSNLSLELEKDQAKVQEEIVIEKDKIPPINSFKVSKSIIVVFLLISIVVAVVFVRNKSSKHTNPKIANTFNQSEQLNLKKRAKVEAKVNEHIKIEKHVVLEEQSKIKKKTIIEKRETSKKDPEISLEHIIGDITELGDLEIAQFDLPDQVNWYDANKFCVSLGKNWRLPTKDELNKLYNNKDKIQGFKNEHYWSSSQNNKDEAWIQYFMNGNQSNNLNKRYKCNVRVVRTLKNSSVKK